MLLQQHLREVLERARGDAGYTLTTPISIRLNSKVGFGDYSSGLALSIDESNTTSMERATKIAEIVEGYKDPIIGQVKVAAPGFVNFFLDSVQLFKLTKDIDDMFGTNDLYGGQRIMVEYTDPNPYKEFHIGHFMPNIIGEAIARLHEYGGATVERVNYQGDVGLHVAKSVWGLIKKLEGDSQTMEELSKLSLLERVKIMGEAYVNGSKAYDDPEAKNEIDAINIAIYEGNDKNLMALYKEGRSWSLEYFETIYKRLGTTFDDYYFESESGKKGLEVVTAHINDGIFEKSEGAVIYRGENRGLHNRVFINSLGVPTYEAKELGLAQTKYERWRYDRSFIVTGNEVSEYFKVLIDAMSRVFPDLATKTTHVGHGMLTLKGAKMSSRTGNILRATDIIDAAKEAVVKVIDQSEKTSNEPLSDREIELVALAAIRYTFLRLSIGKNIVFDFDTSFSFDGDSGPYLLYTYARAVHIIENAKGITVKDSFEAWSGEEDDLIKTLVQFPDVIRDAQESISLHGVTQYLTTLAQTFNSFYHAKRVIEDNEVDGRRLSLVLTVKKVLSNGMYVLGIEPLDRM
ncbi:arginine--tRNA ligase [bacterium]|uniref:Arginine--tRNA ligase n=2 Tax=Katanobacteria TaxID=422282 RepID=A0A2H0BFU3_UNCKA|nr:arginine--tRNA ligase [bacterium]PIP56439.1 MAG: arginine--tRNA ligase [candidate division WWE3 bacterium CG22_combo_CG10-13_8_21_14_all_39_12]